MTDQAASTMHLVPRHGRQLLALFALLLLALAGRAHAGCQYTNKPGAVTFTPPTTITLSNSLPVGTILWTSSQIDPTSPPTLNCENTTTNNGIANTSGNPTGSDETLFPTSVPGLSYRILHPDSSTLLSAYPYNASVPAGQITFNVASALQLVVTGTIAPGSVLTGGQFAQWNVDMCNGFSFGNFYCYQSKGTYPVETFSTTSITFIAPACTVAVDPTVVTLPAVLASAFTGKGATTGQTLFNVQLNCQASANLAITLATSNQQTGTTSVIAPTAGSGYAGNVGVQILDGHSGNPITFGTAISEGTTTSGAMNLPFYARYYQTGTSVSAGNVTATATYTLTYQ